MRQLFFLSLCALLALCTSCSNNDQFRVNGTIDGKATMNLRINYLENGALRTIVTAAREGNFEFFASAPQPTIVEINDYDNRPLARLYAVNGETFDLKIDRSKPYNLEIQGNELSGRWADFLRNNSEKMSAGRDSANAVIARYIALHPDDILSTLLLITNYNSSEDAFAADSLLSLIDAKARPSSLTENYTIMLERLVNEHTTAPIESFRFLNADTARTFRPSDNKANLLAFTLEEDDDYKALANLLERHAKKNRKAFIVDLRTDPIRVSYEGADTCTRILGRLPGGIAAPGIEKLGIPRLPFFIVTDNEGNQLYRGTDSGAALNKLDSLSKTD